MFLDQKAIKLSRKKLSGLQKWIEEKSGFCRLGSDPTRLKIVYLLKIHKELCPTDFSRVLNISLSAVSHQLRIFESSQLVKRTKMGKVVCYVITEKGRKFF